MPAFIKMFWLYSSVYQSRVSVCLTLFVCLPAYLSACLSIYLLTYLSICLYVFYLPLRRYIWELSFTCLFTCKTTRISFAYPTLLIICPVCLYVCLYKDILILFACLLAERSRISACPTLPARPFACLSARLSACLFIRLSASAKISSKIIIYLPVNLQQ